MTAVDAFGVAETGGVGSIPLRAWAVAQVTRRYPFLSGCGKLSRGALLRRLSGPVAGDAWLPTAAGEVFAPLEDSIGRSILFTGDYDRKINWIARRAAAAGDTAIDVGANFGLVSTTLSRAVGPAGTVHAFEPNPRVAAYLRRTLARNGMTNVALHQIGLGAEKGGFTLEAPRNNTGGGSLCGAASSGLVDRYSVDVARLVDVVDVDRPAAFMKVDVEGFELAVFEGAAAKFANGSIHSVLFEEHRRCYAERPPETIRFFESFDYDVFAVPRCLTRMRFTPVAEARAARLDARDYLAVARGPQTAALRRRLGLD